MSAIPSPHAKWAVAKFRKAKIVCKHRQQQPVAQKSVPAKHNAAPTVHKKISLPLDSDKNSANYSVRDEASLPYGKYAALHAIHKQLRAEKLKEPKPASKDVKLQAKVALQKATLTAAQTSGDKNSSKSYAQVETSLVARPLPKSCASAKPKRKRAILSVEFTEKERSDICEKAKKANLSVNAYIKVSTLNSDYKPPIDPELHEALFALNRELTAQGRNLNQIAKHLNSGKATPSQGVTLLQAIRRPLVQALLAVKNALVHGMPSP